VAPSCGTGEQQAEPKRRVEQHVGDDVAPRRGPERQARDEIADAGLSNAGKSEWKQRPVDDEPDRAERQPSRDRLET
jgi:hypothetical protein